MVVPTVRFPRAIYFSRSKNRRRLKKRRLNLFAVFKDFRDRTRSLSRVSAEVNLAGSANLIFKTCSASAHVSKSPFFIKFLATTLAGNESCLKGKFIPLLLYIKFKNTVSFSRFFVQQKLRAGLKYFIVILVLATATFTRFLIKS